jgi:arylformamidase
VRALAAIICLSPEYVGLVCRELELACTVLCGAIDMEATGFWHDIIDISLPITSEMAIWPGDPRPECIRITTINGEGMQVSQLTLSTHTGTHLDAPRHFIPDGRTVDLLDPGALVGLCRVIEVKSAEGHISRADLQGFELRAGERVLLKTRNSHQPAGQRFRPDFAALQPGAADYVCEQEVALVGIDGPSIDAWSASDFPCHKRLLRADILVIENLVLRHVMPGIYGLIAAPLNLIGADGCPIRALLTRA